jgi:hypothetical protein
VLGAGSCTGCDSEGAGWEVDGAGPDDGGVLLGSGSASNSTNGKGAPAGISTLFGCIGVELLGEDDVLGVAPVLEGEEVCVVLVETEGGINAEAVWFVPAAPSEVFAEGVVEPKEEGCPEAVDDKADSEGAVDPLGVWVFGEVDPVGADDPLGAWVLDAVDELGTWVLVVFDPAGVDSLGKVEAEGDCVLGEVDPPSVWALGVVVVEEVVGFVVVDPAGVDSLGKVEVEGDCVLGEVDPPSVWALGVVVVEEVVGFVVVGLSLGLVVLGVIEVGVDPVFEADGWFWLFGWLVVDWLSGTSGFASCSTGGTGMGYSVILTSLFNLIFLLPVFLAFIPVWAFPPALLFVVTLFLTMFENISLIMTVKSKVTIENLLSCILRIIINKNTLVISIIFFYYYFWKFSNYFIKLMIKQKYFFL